MNQISRFKHIFAPTVVVLLMAVTLPTLAGDIPSSPDGTVRAVAEGLADGHPEIFWKALPPTYQKDITELTHAFAEKMDPAVWEASFGLCRRVTALLRDKKDIILSTSMMQAAGEESEKIEGGWDEGIAMFDSLFASDVTRLDALKTIDWEKFLATTGRDLMNLVAERSKADGDDTFDREFTQKLRQTKIEVVSSEGDNATLRAIAPDEEPEEMKLTRVEGRWVPSDMAQDWDKEVAEAKEKLAAITDEEIQQGSMQAMMMIGMVDGVLGELESVETAEEFEQAIQAVMGPFLGGMMGGGEDMYDDSEYSEEAESE